MRKKYEEQLKLSYLIPNNKIGKELESISNIIKDNNHILNMVHQDLIAYRNNSVGRKGLNANQVLRSAILKQYHNFSYDDLEFHLADSSSCQAFARIEPNQCPKKSALQNNIKAISAETWEEINKALVRYSQYKNIEKGRMTRTDATAVDTDIHRPSDSTLLQDGIRVITRTLQRAQQLQPSPALTFSDHNRSAKKKVLTISNNQKKRNQAYKKLLKLGTNVEKYAHQAIPVLASFDSGDFETVAMARMLADQLQYYTEIMSKVIDQTKRRILHGETVPAKEKIISFFECHSDIIKKENRETQFGHKVYITTGKSGLIVDCYLPRGNPNDKSVFPELLARQKEVLNKSPRQMSADGGFTSKDNLEKAQEDGVKDMVFAKKGGLKRLDMAKSDWVYKKLRNFRAGIEGIISVLKRAFGLSRCTWKSWEGFKRYVWSNIVTFNLQIMARA